MSKNISPSVDFLGRLKSGSTKSFFAFFVILFVLVSATFYLLIDRNEQSKREQLIEVTALKSELTGLGNQIENQTQNSLKNCLLFNVSKKELDRFQTIYTLKSTKDLYDTYKNQALSVSEESGLKDEFQVLSELLTDYDHRIAASINIDGKLEEILKRTQQESDSLGGAYLFEAESIGMEQSDAKILENIQEQIQNQLFIIDNHFETVLGGKLDVLKSNSPIWLYVVFTLIMIVLLMILGYLIGKRLNSSIDDLSNILDHIAKGELPEKGENQDGEFTKIVDASNQLVNYLDDASQFAVKIGDGDFNYEFKPKSKDDALGNSLIDMRNRLQEVTRQDKIRNWINEGQAKFGELLRQHSDNIEQLGSHVIINLVEYLGASQAGLFIVKEEGEEHYLELLSTYAYKRKKFIDKKIEIGEGLAGQALEEGKTIYMTDIKTDHYDIQTGLGESRPSSLLIVPLKEDDRIEGIIEIASLKELEKFQIEFVESIGESLASSLSAGKVNQTTKKLLEETQEKAEQMKAQEEELRQNMEELAATQEQMERRNKEMEEIQQKLAEEKYLLNALLNSSHDRIYFKDKDSKFIRVSSSMVELFDKESEQDVIGKSDFDFGFGEHAKAAFEDEQSIIRSGNPMVDMVEKEKWDDGRMTWVSTTKNPLTDLDGKIIGTYGISRDITKNKLMELEMIKRKDWLEHFFNFHPTGFVVLDQDGKVDFASNGIMAQLDFEGIENKTFGDIFKNMEFKDLLHDIDFENVKDKEVEITMSIKGNATKSLAFIAVSGSIINEDGTQNIFLIQK